jgi:hypothetical protein
MAKLYQFEGKHWRVNIHLIADDARMIGDAFSKDAIEAVHGFRQRS